MTDETLIFPDRAAFRAWLFADTAGESVWLVFSKSKKALKTLSAARRANGPKKTAALLKS